MIPNFVPFLTLALITAFTPGPNNLTSASFSMQVGYKRILPYLAGIASGVTATMIVCATLSGFFMKVMPGVEVYLRYVGAAYILWLAYKTLKANYNRNVEIATVASYWDGLFLQFVNPKGILYGLMVFSTFFSEVLVDVKVMSMIIFIIIIITFSANSTWALFGAIIKRYMQNQRMKNIINVVLALSLVYTAFIIAGIV